jgi:hypothetical protein
MMTVAFDALDRDGETTSGRPHGRVNGNAARATGIHGGAG